MELLSEKAIGTGSPSSSTAFFFDHREIHLVGARVRAERMVRVAQQAVRVGLAVENGQHRRADGCTLPSLCRRGDPLKAHSGMVLARLRLAHRRDTRLAVVENLVGRVAPHGVRVGDRRRSCRRVHPVARPEELAQLDVKELGRLTGGRTPCSASRWRALPFRIWCVSSNRRAA